MKIAIGCDEMGFELKQHIIEALKENGYEYEDFGSYDGEKILYPNIAEKVAKEVAGKNFDRGIIICGTGIGVAITANKVHGIRAAQVTDIYQAERAAKSNDANIITMGGLTTGKAVGEMLVLAYLKSEFQGGRSKPKVDRMNEIDNHYRGNEKE
ncbi:MAG TPA: ribose-5-phosphate isomerase [Clostridiaceae bacterium]|nr:ribose-5-phosphate isomerase [Clostridiaceae bacterium]